MAQNLQDSEASSVTTSTSTNNSWWQQQEVHHHASSNNIPWATGSDVNRWRPQMLPPPQQRCDHEGDHVLVKQPGTTLTGGSGLTVDSNNSVPVETTHLWSQVLLSSGEGARSSGMHHHQNPVVDSGNFLDLLNSKTIAPEMFDLPACDYLKKIDTTSATTNSSSSWEFNPLASYAPNPNPNPNLNQTEPGLGHLSDLVNNWSIAPPNTNFVTSSDHVSHIKHENPNLPSYANGAVLGDGGVNNYPDFGSPVNSFLRSCQLGMNINSPVLGLNNKLCGGGLLDAPNWCNNGARSLSDVISFSGSLNKPAIDLKGFRTCVPSSDSTAESRKPRPDSPARTSSRGSGTSSEGKKKRSEGNSEAGNNKKSKQEASTTSSPKVQVPKVKMAEKITALQQIVSPFGKTDTASVLLEAINYIKYLHEQVQLFSDPYMKTSANKEHNAWGAIEKKEKTEASQDLRSRGLCLVPVSCTPQVYRDVNIPDYSWNPPPYRNCLYRGA